MGKGPIYCKEFSFPSEFGFTSSAGKTHVSGYARGGKVESKGEKLSPKGHAKQSRPEGGKVTPNNTWPLTKNNARITKGEDDARDNDVNADVTYSKKGGRVQRHRDKMGPIEEHDDGMAKGGKTHGHSKHGHKAHHKASGGKFIAGAIKHPGALHKQLGVPEGKKIPAAKLEKAAHAGGKLGQRARFAETLKGMHKKTGGVVKQYAHGGHVTPVKAVHKHEGHMHKGESVTKFAKGGHAKHHGGGGGGTAKKAAGALARIAAVAEKAQPGGPSPVPPPGMPLRLNPRAGAPMPAPGPMPPPGMRKGGHKC